MACGDFKHPLRRGGTNQSQRLTPALAADYVRVDEKDLADWIVYAGALSAFIKYYDLDNQATGTWSQFFSRDVSALLAFFAVQDPAALDGVATRFNTLRDDANQANAALLGQNFAELFGAELTFSKALDDLVARLSDETSLKLIVTNLIKSKLAPALNRLLGYYKAAQGDGLLAEADAPGWKILGAPVVKASTVIAGGLSKGWITNGAVDWATYAAGIVADASIYGAPAGTIPEKIRHAANHNLFSSLFDQYLMAYARILKEAQTSLDATLGEWRKHPPHYALFLA
ncbi:MAG TPA: hypothetical protein VHH73_06760, partial [Verrucomicrobiae bacterium]|nr:hypothetical protein [Verrucomicrobiae bacterium]